jgi:PAS domain S-box-containing protein
LLACCLLCCSTGSAQVKEVKRVLIFYGLGFSSPAAVLVDREIRAALDNSPYQIERYTEYLEPILFSDQASQQQIREGYIRKYRDRRPDVVIAVGPSPIKFLADSHHTFLANVPIVFCASSEDQLGNLKLDSQFTGAWRTLEPEKTLEAAMYLQPTTKHVFVVGGVSSYDQRLEKLVREHLHTYESQFEFTYLTDLQMPELLRRLEHLPPNTIIFYTAISQDPVGRRYIDETQSLPMVVRAANAPVFVIEDTMIGQGTVGGYATSYAGEGRAAGEVAVRMLKGERPENVPVTRDADLYMFDWKALRRWGFKESSLPPNSIVLNREATVWQSYARYIWAAVLLFVAQTLLTLGLLWQRARKREFERSLGERLAFEKLLSDLSGTFINLPEEQVASNIEKSLGRIATFLKLDRVTLFECSGEGTELTPTSSWHSEGTQPVPPDLKPIPWPWWTSSTLRGKPVTLSDPRVLPGEASHVRQYLLESGIQSIASVPLGIGGEIVGAISFASTKRRVAWTDDLIRQLKVLAEIFSNALKRKRAQQALLASQAVLQESEERLRVALDAGRLGGFEWDLKSGRNPWFGGKHALLGMKPGDRSGSTQDFWDRVHPKDVDQLRKAIEIAKQNRGGYESEFRVVWPDGTVHWLRSVGRFSYASDGQAECLLGISMDITERKRTHEALRESEERLRLAQEAAHVGIFEWDIQENKNHWSPEMERIYGLSVGSFGGTFEAWLEHVHPDDREQLEQQARRHFQEGGTLDSQYRTVRPSGEIRWLFSRGTLFHNTTGKPVRMLGFSIDVTDRKRAEEALRESEERFRLVANTAPVMIWMSGPDKLCTYFNQPWLEFTGRTLEAELGNGWAEGVHPEDFGRCLDTYIKSFDRREDFQMEYRMRRYDGEYRWLSDIGVPRFNPDGTFAGYIGSCIDITERKLADEALSSVSRKLIEAHEEERTRIARELHDDINQRLALLEIDLEELGLNPPNSSMEVSSRAKGLRTRLSEIGIEIQAISHRLHSSKLEYLGIVAAITSFSKELSDRQKIDIQFTHDLVPTSLPYDISLSLFRVVQEALRNAVKHSGVRHFEVDLRGTLYEIQLTVHDAGAGFDLSSTMTNPGLGLVSMQERIRLVKGTISIVSNPSTGTTIQARVPLGSSSNVGRAARQ